jgi:aspartate/tyrosine/aromatic aminotransferase
LHNTAIVWGNAFTTAAAELAYGADSSAIKDNRLVITQTISGTGAPARTEGRT